MRGTDMTCKKGTFLCPPSALERLTLTTLNAGVLGGDGGAGNPSRELYFANTGKRKYKIPPGQELTDNGSGGARHTTTSEQERRLLIIGNIRIQITPVRSDNICLLHAHKADWYVGNVMLAFLSRDSHSIN